MVRVDDLTTLLDDTVVHEDLSFSVAPGTFAALIGPSGCGKTTLLRALAGLLPPPRAGRIHVHGRTAMVFQHPTLLPWATVLDNAVFGMEATGTPDRARAAELLASMDLGDWLQARPAQLSVGMQQRVNLARALLVEPDVLLLDEPFSALDALTRHALWTELLGRVAARGTTVVLVSHALDEVVALADRVHVLTDRPSRVFATMDLDILHPRTAPERAHAVADAQTELAASLRRAGKTSLSTRAAGRRFRP